MKVLRNLLALVLFFLSALAHAQPKEIAGAKQIVFLGDSITQGGLYINYLEGYLATRFPTQRWEIINLGLSSETVSGLSEPGHAGGNFPRPDLHERLTRALDKTKPDLVFACYGMNDGIYFPLNEERLDAFKRGMQKLHTQVQAARARIIHITPPTFDAKALSKTLPAGLEAYPQPFAGYNDVLGTFSAWLLAQREQGWVVIDLHGPMDRDLAARRQTAPAFKFAGDGVHPNGNGHWIFTREILRFLNATNEVDACALDARKLTVQKGTVTNLKTVGGEFTFEWTTRIPMPEDPAWDQATREQARAWNKHQIKISGLPALRYQIFEGATPIAVVSRDALAAGLNLLPYTNLVSNQRAAALFGLVQQHQRILAEAWLSEVGHKRPGIAKGLPLAQAEEKAAGIWKQIEERTAPLHLHIRLKPL